MNDTAYVCVVIDPKTLQVKEVKIFSEPAQGLSRMRSSPIYATLFSVKGPDFHTARLRAIEAYNESWIWEDLRRRFPLRADV